MLRAIRTVATNPNLSQAAPFMFGGRPAIVADTPDGSNSLSLLFWQPVLSNDAFLSPWDGATLISFPLSDHYQGPSKGFSIVQLRRQGPAYINIFRIGTNNQADAVGISMIEANWFPSCFSDRQDSAANAWTNYALAKGTTATTPAGIWMYPDTLDVFILGTRDTIYQETFALNPDGTPANVIDGKIQNWETPIPNTSRAASAPNPIVHNNNLYVFYQNLDNKLECVWRPLNDGEAWVKASIPNIALPSKFTNNAELAGVSALVVDDAFMGIYS